MKGRVAAVMVVTAGMVACNEHPVQRFDPGAIVEMQRPTEVDPSQKLDLLWVIDNSGSMCEEQTVLRENFDRFIETLDEAVLDVHIGVTTTHMRVGRSIEPVALPGHLQSTPQPIPYPDGECHLARGTDGSPIAGDYTPVRDLIETSVNCMREPDETLLDVSDEDIAGSLVCDLPGMCRPDEGNGVRLFPESESYRELAKVLKSSNYRNEDGTLHVERMRRDFACMALVGTRGWGVEKGLGAMLAAVSPELTGGSVDAPTDVSAPNHGFIRSDARFATIFVTDENDCTHDGSLTQSQGACGDDICEYWNHPAMQGNSPLLEPELIRDALVSNLAATKAEPTFDAGSVLVASIHGRAGRYDGSVVPDQTCRVDDQDRPTSCEAFALCNADDYEALPPTCASQLGRAYSGDRYERFLRSFPEGQYFPGPDEDADAPLTGWMCTGDFRPALVAIAEFLGNAPSGCITDPIQQCNPTGDNCPSHAGGDPGQCVGRPNSEEFFCDSYIQVRVNAASERRDSLVAAGFCGAESETGDCIVSPTAYELVACSGGVSGVKIDWADPGVARQALAGSQLELRWVSTSGL